MVDFRTRAERRDSAAADRDDAADGREAVSDGRDTVADRRDVEAGEREQDARQDFRELDDRLTRIRQEILDRFARMETTTIDPADWPDITPAGLARLRAHAAEQRRLAALDRTAVVRLLDDVRDGLLRTRRDRATAARDRHHSAEDRHHSALDRLDSARDRESAAADRGHAAIEREQVQPPDPPQDVHPRRRGGQPMAERAAQALKESRQRIADTHDHLDRTRGDATS